MADLADMQARLKVLSDAYAAQLPEKLEQIEQAWSKLHRGEWDVEGFQTMHRMVHSLTGSGKTFGFSLLGDVARNLEECLKQIMQAKAALSEEQRKCIQILLAELHQTAKRRDASAGDHSGLIAIARPDQMKAFAANAPASSDELTSARARLRGANILLAEDNPFIQQVAAELLEEVGAKVAVVDNGREALALLNKERFDIVLMDVLMPEMDGYEATRKIRATPRLAGQKVIAMTANAMAEDRERSLASGMDDFITKPIDPDLMVLVLARWIPERTGITPEEGLVADLRSGKERRSGSNRRAAGRRKEDDVINLAILGHLVSDDPVRVRKFALNFLETARETLDEMDAAHTDSDLAALGGLGHKLKSSARTVGAMGFADLCQALESTGKANDLSQAGMLLRQLRPLLERIARQVEQETA